MRPLRIAALALALGAFSICSLPVHAQQDVDPDHFDQPGAVATHVQGSRMPNRHRVPTAHNLKLASKHSRRAHHQQQQHA